MWDNTIIFCPVIYLVINQKSNKQRPAFVTKLHNAVIETRAFGMIFMFSPTTVLESVRARYPRSFFRVRDSTFHTERFTLQWLALVNTVMILLFPYRAGNFIIVCVLPEMYWTDLCTSVCMGWQCCWVNVWLWAPRDSHLSKHKGYVHMVRLFNL